MRYVFFFSTVSLLISCSLSFARPGFGHGKGKGRSSPAVFRWRPWKALQDPRQENAPIGAPSHIAWLLHRNFPGFHRASRRVRRSSCSPRQILYHNPADFAADAEFFCAARSLADPQGLQALHLHIRRPLKNLTQEFSQSLAISSGGGKYETSSDASREACENALKDTAKEANCTDWQCPFRCVFRS